MATNAAEMASQPSQCNTRAELLHVHLEKAKNDEETKFPAEQEIDLQPGAPEVLSGLDHEMDGKVKEQPADKPPFSGPALNNITKEETLDEHFVRPQDEENPAPPEEKNEGNNARQAEIQKSPDQTSLANDIDARASNMDGNEDTGRLMYELINEVGHYREKSLLERVRLAPRRVVQSMSYVQLVEDRLVYLEKKVLGMGKDIKSLSGQALDETKELGENEKGEDGRPLILDVNRISVAQDQEIKKITLQELWEYKSKRRRATEQLIELAKFESKLWTGHIIDVVVPDPGFENAPLSLSANVKRDIADQVGLGLNEGRKQNPSRVRIHSTLLLDLLEHISDQKFVECKQQGQSHQTFLQPFKVFVMYEKDIRKWAERLQGKHIEGSLPSEVHSEAKEVSEKATTEAQKSSEAEQQTAETPSADAIQAAASDAPKEQSTTESDKEPQFWTKECLHQLNVLIKLFDNDLKPVFDDRDDAESGQLGSITYANLWHIFGSGEEIQSAQGEPQIYRVLTTVGGRPFLCTRRQAGMNEDEEERLASFMYRTSPTGSPFVIQAFYYDFDGTAIGPVNKTFTIQPFEGRRLITSLPCYPIRFAKGAADVSQYRQELVERGRRFVQLATDGQKIHYRYSGLALDQVSQTREQVISPNSLMEGMRRGMY